MTNKIRQCRMRKGLSQQELARAAKLSRATVSGLERGRITVTTTKTLMKIAEALQTSIDAIFFDAQV